MLIIVSCLLLSSCGIDPDKRSTITIKSKEFSRYEGEGKYHYEIYISCCLTNYNDYYSDSSYEIGDTLILVKKR